MAISLKKIIKSLPDFKSEIMLLQYHALQLGVQVKCSPKYHPEIAGEAIEFAWGLAKNTYWRYPLKQKKNRENFKK